MLTSKGVASVPRASLVILLASIGSFNLPAWPVYSIPDRATMLLDDDCRVEADPTPTRRTVWETTGSAVGLLP